MKDGGWVVVLAVVFASLAALLCVVFISESAEPERISTGCAGAKIIVEEPDVLGMKNRDLYVLCFKRLEIMGR